MVIFVVAAAVALHVAAAPLPWWRQQRQQRQQLQQRQRRPAALAHCHLAVKHLSDSLELLEKSGPESSVTIWSQCVLYLILSFASTLPWYVPLSPAAPPRPGKPKLLAGKAEPVVFSYRKSCSGTTWTSIWKHFPGQVVGPLFPQLLVNYLIWTCATVSNLLVKRYPNTESSENLSYKFWAFF